MTHASLCLLAQGEHLKNDRCLKNDPNQPEEPKPRSDYKWIINGMFAMNGNLWFHWLDSLALIKDTAVSPCIAHATEAACHT